MIGIESGPVEQSFLVLLMADLTSLYVDGRKLKVLASFSGKLLIMLVNWSLHVLFLDVKRSEVVLKCSFSLLGSSFNGERPGFKMRWIVCHTSLGRREDNAF